MFGGSVAQWKRKFKVECGAKSELAEAFEKEMRRARILIAEQEIKRSGARGKKSDKTWMSEAVSREEERIMLKMQQETAKQGWETGTLIHDAIIVQRKSIQNTAEKGELERAVEAALSGAMVERGWAVGSARAKVTKM